MGINEKSSGEHYIFTGGTGILPFLDFFDYLLKKVVFETIMKDRNLENIDCPFPHENYVSNSILNPKFKVILFASFKDDSEFVGKEILKELGLICRQKKLEIVDIYIRFSSKTQSFDDYRSFRKIEEHFDEPSIFSSILNRFNLAKAYIVDLLNLLLILQKLLKENIFLKKK